MSRPITFTLAEKHPDILSQWDYEKNIENNIFPDKVGFSTRVMAWWKCKNDHSYSMVINSKTRKICYNSCPLCSGKIFSYPNSLEYKYKDKITNWNYEINNKNNIFPDKISIGAHKKIYFNCEKCKRSYCQYPHDYFKKNRRCPYCTGKKIDYDNSFAKKYPEELKLWNYELNNKLNIYPDKIAPKSNKKVYMICPRCNKNYYISLGNFAKGERCHCYRSSYGEERIRKYFLNNNVEFVKEKRFEDCPIPSCSYDFYLPDHNLLIEYDGIQHFRAVGMFGGEKVLVETQARDAIKNEFATKKGITLIRIPYWDYDNIETILSAAIKQQ